MWCDTFDGDLYRLVPSARDVIAPAAAVQLFTTAHTTDGKINLPTCWNSDNGFVCFVGFDPVPPQPAWYWTDRAVVSCTFEELMRDMWAHCPIDVQLKTSAGYVQLLDGEAWEQRFWSLLWDVRHSQPGYGARARGRDQQRVCAVIRASAEVILAERGRAVSQGAA